MPQMNNVVLSDGTDNHTFNPRGIDTNGVATLVESTGVPIGDKRLTVARNRTSAGREKTTLKFVVPVVQDVVVAGVSKPTAVRAAYADVTFSFDGTSSSSERNDIRNYLVSFLETQMASDLIDSLETLY